MTAKFIGGYMDGEICKVKSPPPPTYHFARSKQISSIVSPTDIEIVPPDAACWIEEYVIDSWEGEMVFYRRNGLPPQRQSPSPDQRGREVMFIHIENISNAYIVSIFSLRPEIDRKVAATNPKDVLLAVEAMLEEYEEKVSL